MRWLGWLLLVVVSLLGAVVISYRTVPDHTTEATHFDTLIVLGCPANPDGSPSPEQRERVMEGVREFRVGRAPHMILTGAGVKNSWVEADVMTRLAEAEGVPAEAIVPEPQARNTIQNIYYSQALMLAHGWGSAEVISTADHLPRTGLILEHWHFAWRTHAAGWPRGYPLRRIVREETREMVGTAGLRWFGFRPTPFLPGS